MPCHELQNLNNLDTQATSRTNASWHAGIRCI